MSDRIEEKIPMYTKSIVLLIFIFFLWFIIDFRSTLLTSGIDNTEKLFFILFMFFGIPVLSVLGVIFSKSATKLIIENDSIIVKQVLRKPIVIQLKK